MRAAARDDPLDATSSVSGRSAFKASLAAAGKQVQGQASGLPQTPSSASLSSAAGGQGGGSMGGQGGGSTDGQGGDGTGGAGLDLGSGAEAAGQGDGDGQASDGVDAVAAAAAAAVAATVEEDLQAAEAARSNLLQVGAGCWVVSQHCRVLGAWC